MDENKKRSKSHSPNPERESGGSSPGKISNPASSQRLVCWQFIEEYASPFARHFEKCYKESRGETSSEWKPPVSSEYLYHILFTIDRSRESKQEAKKVLEDMVRHTFEAETILTHTFFYMVKDVIDCLLIRKGRLHELDTIMSLIHEVTKLLFEAYYKVTRPVTIIKPDIDRSSKDYQGILETFGKYLDSEAEDKDGPELTIHTYYRSIPIELNAAVKTVNTEGVTFNIHPYEAVALSHLGMAVVKSSLHDAVFKAYTSAVNLEEKTATFSHFIPEGEDLHQRSHIRVEPGSTEVGKIITHLDETPAIIYCISEVSVTLYVRNITISHYEPGTSVRFIACLTDAYGKGTIPIDIEAVITMLCKEEKGDRDSHLIVLDFEADTSLRSDLAQYVSQRQVEIIRELKDLSQSD